MTVRKVTLPYGQKSVEIRIPEGNLVGVYSPCDVAPVAKFGAETVRRVPIVNHPYKDPDALDAALAQKGFGARVTVLTHAPEMLPRITPGCRHKECLSGP